MQSRPKIPRTPADGKPVDQHPLQAAKPLTQSQEDLIPKIKGEEVKDEK